MKRALALFWLACVLVAGIYLAARLHHGLNFHTDLMALLPQDQQNPDIQQANDAALQALSRHIVILVGAPGREAARDAAAIVSKSLDASGEVSLSAQDFSKDSLRQIGTFYFPYRAGLLSDPDRQLLLDGKGRALASQAAARAYGMMGFANADMLHADPFMLMADFFTGLPVPDSRMRPDDGMLTATDNGTVWIMLSGQLRRDAFTLATQDAVSTALNNGVNTARAAHADMQVLRLGAVFFAKAGAEQALHETSWIGVISSLGTLLLIWLSFRGWTPLLLSLLAIATGILMAFAGGLWLFGDLHVGALLFGTSLIGVTVDYSLQYCCEIFSPQRAAADQRLRRVLTAITLGATTTVIGYLTFLLAPFPGLHQIAVFSAIGIISAWLTVVAWFPLLDRSPAPAHGHALLTRAAQAMTLWETPRTRKKCLAVLAGCIILGFAGMARIHADDDVHHMQSLNPELVAAQQKITPLIGKGQDSQMFIVQAADEETALRNEESLTPRLQALTREGDLKSFQSLSQYIPSVARQMENRRLTQEQLYHPLLKQQASQLHLTQMPLSPDAKQPFLTPDAALAQKDALPFLSALEIGKNSGGVMHLVMLDGVANPAHAAAAAEGLSGVRFVDPAGDFSSLIGKYRQRALALLALSALLMSPLLIARYGFAKGIWIMLPPALAVLLAPALCSLAGNSFTFFDAMALVLVLSIGVDYAIFFAETSAERKAVTMLAVTLAACTALLSFGLLALSHVAAVRHFGTTMLAGISISFLLAPMARFIKPR